MTITRIATSENLQKKNLDCNYRTNQFMSILSMSSNSFTDDAKIPAISKMMSSKRVNESANVKEKIN